MAFSVEWELALFLIIASWCLLCSLLTISVRKIMHAVVWLINLMIGVAALYIYLSAEFIGMVQLIVYAGGIMVLMLFGIMLTGKDPSYTPSEFVSWKYSLPPALLLLITGIFAIVESESEHFLPEEPAGTLNAPEALRIVALGFFTDYQIVLVILGLILLAALIGSVYLIKREVWESKEGGIA